MKIVDVAEFYTDEGGGVKTYINQKLEAASRLGHEMVIIAPGESSSEEVRHGGRVIWVRGPKLPLDPRYVILWNKKEVHNLLDRENPDIVEGSSVWTGGHFVGSWKGDAVKSLIFHQDPVAVYPQTFLGNIISHHTIDRLFQFFWNYTKRLSNRFDVTVVSGDWLKHRLREFGIHNSTAIPFGINKSFFSPAKRDLSIRASLLKEIGLPVDAHLFICVSRFHPEKRLSTVIDGFKKASKQKKMGLIVFGGGPMERWIKWKSRNLKNFKLMGFTSDRDELAKIMASCDYFVHGSSAETFGLVVAEAICSGLPIIVPNTGGATDLANPGYAEVYDTGNSKSLAKAMISICNQNREVLTRNCKMAAEKKIQKIDDHFDHLFSFYEDLVNQR